MSFFKGSMQFPESEKPSLPDEELEVLEKVSSKVVERRMAVPAIMFLESVKPLNYIGSQTMVFFEPIIQTVFNFRDYNTLRSALEKRHSIEILIQKIESLDSVSFEQDKRIKKFMKKEKKKWKWYQRWLGIFIPKVNIPDEVLNPSEDKPTPDNK